MKNIYMYIYIYKNQTFGYVAKSEWSEFFRETKEMVTLG